MEKQNKEFFKAQELAKKLSINVMTVYRYIKTGKLKAYKIGKEFRIKKTDFDDLLMKSSAQK